MNQPPKGIQDYIYLLEEGAGKVWLRRFLFILIAAFLGTVYHLTEFKNLNAPEAMDAAQVGRNVAEGKGFTTQFIRPAAVFLLEKHAAKKGLPPNQSLKQAPPDISNAPVYPLILAGWMKALPFKHRIMEQNGQGIFERHQPDVLIGYLNLGFFALLLLQVFQFGLKHFDGRIAGLSVALLFGSEILWRFTYSGLSTLFLANVFFGLFRVLTTVGDSEESPTSAGKAFLTALGLGVLLALGCLTRYGFGWFLLPVGLYLLLRGGKQRWLMGVVTVGTFLVLIAPWLYRNYTLCGQPFGAATYAIAEETGAYPGTRLLRSFKPDINAVNFEVIRSKFVTQTLELLQTELSRLGGSWLSAFFLVGLLVPYRTARLQAARWLLVGLTATAAVVQALGRTWLTSATPTVNSENQLVLILPALIVFGVAFFYMLIDRLEFPVEQLRSILVGVFAFVASLPFLFAVLPPRSYALNYPPYKPDIIQVFAGFLKPDELLMTDMPWATAWYGERNSIWLPTKVKDARGDDFFAVHDGLQHVGALYITPITADTPLRPAYIRDIDHIWGRFYMDALLTHTMPDGFPLKYMYGAGMIEAGHFFLTDWPRWMKKEKGE